MPLSSECLPVSFVLTYMVFIIHETLGSIFQKSIYYKLKKVMLIRKVMCDLADLYLAVIMLCWMSTMPVGWTYWCFIIWP
jgi:hypothetical protein